MTTISELLPSGDDLRLGAPQHAGALTVFPLFGAEPRLEYTSFAQARAAGASVSELPGGASVNDLVVHNPTALPVLLFEGEEVIGAQQNRTFDVSVLVRPGEKLVAPVSCVEAGRWDGSRHTEAFDAAPQAAYPALRRAKNTVARSHAVAGAEARADQGAVWNEIAGKSARMQAPSATGAMHDVFEHHRSALDAMCRSIERLDGQIGAVVAIGGRCTVLDVVSRSDVWAALHRPLVQGYALDALEARDDAPVAPAVAAGWLAATIATPVTERPAIGAGIQLHVETPVAAGSGLACDGELVQLSAFAPDASAVAGRIRRPSRRRL
jgi:hypothetical protein